MISADLSPLSSHSTSGSGVKADLCDGYDCSVQILGIFNSAVVPFTNESHLETLGKKKHNAHLCMIKQQILHMHSGCMFLLYSTIVLLENMAK